MLVSSPRDFETCQEVDDLNVSTSILSCGKWNLDIFIMISGRIERESEKYLAFCSVAKYQPRLHNVI